MLKLIKRLRMRIERNSRPKYCSHCGEILDSPIRYEKKYRRVIGRSSWEHYADYTITYHSRTRRIIKIVIIKSYMCTIPYGGVRNTEHTLLEREFIFRDRRTIKNLIKYGLIYD